MPLVFENIGHIYKVNYVFGPANLFSFYGLDPLTFQRVFGLGRSLTVMGADHNGWVWWLWRHDGGGGLGGGGMLKRWCKCYCLVMFGYGFRSRSFFEQLLLQFSQI
ncbi:hypothetical protein AAZX31_03G089500 [Glycine max]|uniref:Uncharacterized protein n=2 Tax=Glycine subgen. Soja TaxID=1462606 RepID=K7KE66_SOYBN|nr:hypothetical protein JHK87_006877 [Glycine soja]KAG5054733.1 hypothetical protein JHK85_007243 [Glycine max]KAG5071828.1 hypothetical protein JHK86_007039 [Glycine max]KAH1069342.1 hypothetical protein GYH30_006805 [Glycine max]KRH66375.1 hypothetical protein GLYMA_03G102400v4 [Glycine max]